MERPSMVSAFSAYSIARFHSSDTPYVTLGIQEGGCSTPGEVECFLAMIALKRRQLEGEGHYGVMVELLRMPDQGAAYDVFFAKADAQDFEI